MTIKNLLTFEALQVALAARQALIEIEAAVLMAEIVLREQAQKSRSTSERRAA